MRACMCKYVFEVHHHLHVCMYVTVYVSMYVCMYVCMYVRIYACVYVCVKVCMCVCVYAIFVDETRYIILSFFLFFFLGGETPT